MKILNLSSLKKQGPFYRRREAKASQYIPPLKKLKRVNSTKYLLFIVTLSLSTSVFAHGFILNS